MGWHPNLHIYVVCHTLWTIILRLELINSVDSIFCYSSSPFSPAMEEGICAFEKNLRNLLSRYRRLPFNQTFWGKKTFLISDDEDSDEHSRTFACKRHQWWNYNEFNGLGGNFQRFSGWITQCVNLYDFLIFKELQVCGEQSDFTRFALLSPQDVPLTFITLKRHDLLLQRRLLMTRVKCSYELSSNFSVPDKSLKPFRNHNIRAHCRSQMGWGTFVDWEL